MANAPDTIFVVGPDYQQLTPQQVMITPNGSTQTTLSAAVAASGSLAGLYLTTSYANDTAAAAGGVPVGGIYRNGNLVQVRIA